MDMFSDAFDSMNALDRRDNLTVDQQIEIAKVKALISVSQQLSRIHHAGINPEYDSGS